MKKWKRVILIIFASAFVAFAGYILYLFLDDDSVVPGNPVLYHTKDKLTDLYWQNKDLLNSVKNSVLSSKKFLQALIDYKEGDFDISYQGDKKYFTEEEWTDIVSVFEKLHPYMIMLERKGRPVIFYINFDDLKLDSGSKTTELYWFPGEDVLEYHKEASQRYNGEFTQLDEGWYIVEKTYPW
jgi:hypothetical protein